MFFLQNRTGSCWLQIISVSSYDITVCVLILYTTVLFIPLSKRVCIVKEQGMALLKFVLTTI